MLIVSVPAEGELLIPLVTDPEKELYKSVGLLDTLPHATPPAELAKLTD
jgi:hypothetical protein